VFDTQLKAAVIYWLAQSFGMLCDVTTDLNDSWNKKEKMYRVHVVRTQHSIVDIMNPLYVSIQNAMREEDVKLKIREYNQKVMLGKEEVNRIGEYVYDFTTENGHFAAGIGDLIVHNTDSVFVSFGLTDKDGKTKITGKRALEISIELGQKAGALVTRYLKAPHDLEYEKTFLPFILLSKKRYVGMLYETDIERCVRKSMGIVLKRRDNAPIVKDVYGGILDILIQTQDIGKAVEFLDGKIREIVEGRVPLQKLVITKSLRGNYANPKQIAHKVLADRIKERDPGNAPRAGDRIGYVHVHVPTKTKAEEKALLMGEKIELPEVVESRGLKVDSGYYLTNQIMNPVQQLFALVMEELKGFRALEREYERTIDKLWENSFDSETFEKKRAEARGKVVKKLLFDPHLMRVENVRHGRQEITNFFKRV
jgi:DNA polymerase elongation subunit (family B)